MQEWIPRARRPKPSQKREPIFRIENVNFYYGDKRALKSINVEIAEKKATAFIGPSGCGKTTLLRCLNRMNDLILNTRVTGNIKLDGKNIYDPSTDVIQLAPPCRHDFSEVESVSQKHLRKCHLRAPYRGHQ